MNKKCAMTNCNKKHHARFLCNKHYKIALAKGHFEPLKKFKITQRTELHRKYNFSGNYYKVLERDNNKCTNCGLTNYRHKMLYDGKSLHVHHIDKKGSQVKSKDRNNKLDNLIALCWSCHTKADQGLLKEYMGYTLEVEDDKVVKKFKR